MITIFDVETTGLLESDGTNPVLQPHITEIYAMQVTSSGKLIKELDTLVKPPIPIPDHITKITGIADATVAKAPSFIEIYKDLVEVFFCSHTVVAHNLAFDEGMIITELRRAGKEHFFPYPPMKFCTVEQSMHLKGHRLKNSELYTLATGKELVGAHRAKIDVQATYESYKFLIQDRMRIRR